MHWQQLPEPAWQARDRRVAHALGQAGVHVSQHPGHFLQEPGKIVTKEGGPYKVFAPFWNAIRPLEVGEPLGVPRLRGLRAWPASQKLSDWQLQRGIQHGAAVVARHVRVGEQAARRRLEDFIENRVSAYGRDRDRLDRPGASGLSENLTWGEISVREVWTIARRQGGPGADSFLRELAWREFAWHLLHHFPKLASSHWREEWNTFPWRPDNGDAERWRRGMTGEPLVDAGMRELFVTGTMHNRVRLVAASYLTKHLLTDWRVGLAWFEDCLIDWDPASNALNWQWAAGSGPDAAPYFRIFNPAGQADRYDPDGAYRRQYLRGWGGVSPTVDADAFFDAIPRSWALNRNAEPPEPVISLAEGRRRALAAYEAFRHP